MNRRKWISAGGKLGPFEFSPRSQKNPFIYLSFILLSLTVLISFLYLPSCLSFWPKWAQQPPGAVLLNKSPCYAYTCITQCFWEYECSILSRLFETCYVNNCPLTRQNLTGLIKGGICTSIYTLRDELMEHRFASLSICLSYTPAFWDKRLGWCSYSCCISVRWDLTKIFASLETSLVCMTANSTHSHHEGENMPFESSVVAPAVFAL